MPTSLLESRVMLGDMVGVKGSEVDANLGRMSLDDI
jgi:hypothetical protein